MSRVGKWIRLIRWFLSGAFEKDWNNQRLAVGQLLANQLGDRKGTRLADFGFKVYSQFDDDGIIEYLIQIQSPSAKTFIEFGVADYRESNTRFLLFHRNWRGFVMDGSAKNMEVIKSESWFWKYDLHAEKAFITAENINQLLAQSGFRDVGLLHIDLDGNDYHILKAMDDQWLPEILILEYVSLFGHERALTVPYDPAFNRFKTHYSGLIYGASLAALTDLAAERGYALVGCNDGGNNAYFVRRDRLTAPLKELTVEEAFVLQKFRDGLDQSGEKAFWTKEQALGLMKGAELLNTRTGQVESF